MRRPATGLIISLAAVAVVLPAGAANLRLARGSLSAVSSTSVSVTTAKGTVSCKLGVKSPSNAGFVTGERVQIACRRANGHWLLTTLRHAGTTADAANKTTAPPTQFSGAITALTDTAISLHDGNRDLTCGIDATSPSVAALQVGMHVNVSCADGTLASWAPIASGRAYEGKISAIGDSSVSVLSAGGTATCTVGAGSPTRGGFAVGDYVLMGCSIPAGQLVLLRHLTGDSGDSGASGATGATGAAGTASVDQTTKGTITALASGSVTVHNNERGDLTCTIGPDSPSTAGFNVGDLAGMGCKAGVLVIIVKSGTATGASGATGATGATGPTGATGATGATGTASVDQTTRGTITSLTRNSITIHNNERGDLTCSISDGSPSLSGLQIGDLAGMGCEAGVLVVIVKQS